MTAHFTSLPPGEDGLDYALLERYWLNETSPQEAALVRAWFSANPERQEWYTQLRVAIRAGNWTPLTQTDVDRTITRTLRATGLPLDAQSGPAAWSQSPGVHETPIVRRGSVSPLVPSTSHRPQSFKHRRFGAAFAATILGCLLLIAGWYTGTHRVTTKMSSQSWTYATSNGERARVTLPDGSTVDLNVASQLEVSANYETGERTVRLRGEALFTVIPHRGVPFTVIAGPSKTRVLGTSFMVRHYASDTLATVAVRDGKVAVNSVVLSADQKIDVGNKSMSPVHTANAAQFRFADGILAFNSVPLQSTISDLNRWYDADIRLGDPSLASQRVTGECAKGSIADLVELLEGTFNVRVVRDGRTLILYPR